MPRFNHIEQTVPRGFLDTLGKNEIMAFYGEIFGGHVEEPVTRNGGFMHEDGFLVIRCNQPGAPEQRIALYEADRPMSAGEHEAPPHTGLLVESVRELEDYRAKIKAYQQRDPRVELLEWPAMDDVLYPESTLYAFYFRYRMPLWFDVQTVEFRDGRVHR